MKRHRIESGFTFVLKGRLNYENFIRVPLNIALIHKESRLVYQIRSTFVASGERTGLARYVLH
jgi:hypothetical protein